MGELLADTLPTAVSENLQPFAFVLEIAHILDDAAHLHRHLQGDQTGTYRDFRSARLRRGHHHEFRVRQGLRDRNRHIPGAGSHIKQQHVRASPPHIRQELFQRALQAWPAPQDRALGTGEHADGHEFDAPRDHRHEHAVQIGRLRMHAEQPRKREPIDVRVDGRGIVAERCECGGEIRGDRGFADSALAGSNCEDPRVHARLGERVLPAFGLELGDEIRELVLAHRAHFDMGDERRLRVGFHGAVDLARDGFRQRASGDGQFHMHSDVERGWVCIPRRRLDGGDHPQIGDGTSQFRVDDLA